MFALLRYALSDTFHAQRWVAPLVSLGAIIAIVSSQTGPILPTYAILATSLFFIGTWITVMVLNNEDPVQQMITETCSGGRAQVRLAKLLLSFLLSTTLGVVAMFPPIFLSSNKVGISDLFAGAFAIAIAALAATGLGALCSRPIVRRRAWSILLGLLVGLGTVLIPNGVPSRQLLVLFNKTGPVSLALPMLLIALETAAVCALAVTASIRVSMAKS